MKGRTQRGFAAFALTAIAAGVQAQTSAPATPEKLKEVTVTSTRTERNVNEVPNTVTVMTAEEIEKSQAQDIADLIRYEPNVSVRGDSRRFGNSSYSIRGIDGNRVLILVDGVRLADEFSFGSSLLNGAGRDTVDLNTLKRVEILRGAASSLYGSDALGGVVSYTTKDPVDYMRTTDRDVYFGLHGGYASADRSFTKGLTLAAGRDVVQAYLYYSNRTGHETDNRGSIGGQGQNRTEANPQGYRQDSLLGKLVIKPTADQQWRLTYDDRTMRSDTNVLSGVSGLPRVTDLQGIDATSRRRVSLDHEWLNPASWINALRWNIYGQDTNNLQRSRQVRSATTATCSGVTLGTNNCVLDLDTTFQQKIFGGGGTLEHLFSLAGASHRFTWGGDMSKTTTLEQRDGVRVNTTTGATTKTITPDPLFPVHDFPTSDTTLTGLYAQDEAALMGGRLQVITGLRYDSYKLSPQNDAVFAANNAANPANRAAVREITESAFSPKIGATFKFTDVWSAFANYAHGFRAPSAFEAQTAFSNPGSGYIQVPNANLKPEKSRGVEFGTRAVFGGGSAGITYFDNRYRDFIYQVDQCPNNPNCGVGGVASVFQNVNLADVRIYGLELKGDYRINRAFTVLGAVGFANGTDRSRNVAINTVDPTKAVLGLKWAPADHWGGQFTGTFVGAKNRVDDTSGVGFRTPGYEVFDLTGYYNFSKNAQLTFGLFNIFNKKYWNWSDVRLLAVSSSAAAPQLSTLAGSPVDRYTQPGTNASVNFRYHF
jgi:hemoglobin/transferrin/lactoferrin receptor protein